MISNNCIDKNDPNVNVTLLTGWVGLEYWQKRYAALQTGLEKFELIW